MNPRPPSRARTVMAVVSVAVLAAAGCGLAEDGSPEALAVDNVPYDLLDPDPPPATIAPATAGSEAVPVYFVQQTDRTTRLVPAEREVSDPSSLRERLQALIEQPPTSDEVDDGITTLVPSETVLIDVIAIPGTGEAVIDLSREFFELSQGEGQRGAYAQITCTATETPGVDRVSYAIEGEPVAALVADGTTKEGPVSCRPDYLAYDISPTTTTSTTTTTSPAPTEGDQPSQPG